MITEDGDLGDDENKHSLLCNLSPTEATLWLQPEATTAPLDSLGLSTITVIWPHITKLGRIPSVSPTK